MLGISKDGEFLDLSPATQAVLERASPFFKKDSLADEYTLPFTFQYTPKNARLLGLTNHFYTRRRRMKVENVRLFDGNNFSYTGDLIIEAAELNINDIEKSTINGFFQTGVSSFFNAVRNKKIRELELGGIRTFVWTNHDPVSPNKGFWQHIHDTLDGSVEYSFAPIRNQLWSGSTEEGTADWMNKLDNTGTIDFANNYNTLAPQVSLKYVLEKIFTEHGWSFDYSGMDDDQWQTMFMPSFYAVTWQKIIQIATDPFFAVAPLNTISINLQNHVPPTYLIQNMLIDLRNRYNWGFDFDAARKVGSMFPLRNLANGVKKDWTKYMGAKWSSDFSEEPKIFAFKNEIDSADALSAAPDFLKITRGAPVLDFASLPAATDAIFNQVVYCWKENQYYQVRYDETAGTYSWELYANGIYDYEPTGANEEITTAISTMPVYRTLYRDNGVTEYYGLFPLCEQEGNWEGKAGEFVNWGMRLLFHRGLCYEANPAGAAGTVRYPYLTSIAFTITQEEPDLAWSNVYKHEYNGEDLGIIQFWFRDSLKFLEQSELMKGMLYLPRVELINHRWSDVILLRNIPYVVVAIPDVIPYKGEVQAELRRIG